MRDVRSQELERDLAPQFRIVGGVDHPHTARADLLEHFVAADEHVPHPRALALRRDHVGELVHHRRASATAVDVALDFRDSCRRETALDQRDEGVLVWAGCGKSPHDDKTVA